MKILVLCTGNSCRSQMAEGFLKSFDSSMEVYSAGVNPANKVQAQSIAVMLEAGIDISAHYPKNASEFSSHSFDYVITVCDNAKETCPVFVGNVLNRVHIPFEDPYDAVGTPEEILNKYREVRDEIKKILFDFYKLNMENK